MLEDELEDPPAGAFAFFIAFAIDFFFFPPSMSLPTNFYIDAWLNIYLLCPLDRRSSV